MSRSCLSTRWVEQNCAFQCKHCNGFRSGEQYQFAQNLDAKYGKGTADEIVRQSRNTRKFTQSELQAMYNHYKRLSDELRRDKSL
jgi:hypothetical protein